jgi:hypothetical protein
MAEMELKESYERVRFGLKQAADCARKLARVQKSTDWQNVAATLDGLVARAKELYDSGALTRQQTLDQVDMLVDRKIIAEASGKVQ